MFARPHSDTPHLTITVDGQPVGAREGDSVAAALLAAGVVAMRSTPVSQSKRGPYCMMGVCFDCLMIIDGVPSRQACMVSVRDGMRIERQRGPRPLEVDTEDSP
ncbi:MAG: (2Fe-2S)-binding protein [Alphaproteobacteria bacterium]|nr:(2Fe-2S)-binding protein [Alphaproteobacteria bacterium]